MNAGQVHAAIAAGRAGERDDVLAWLEHRAANARAIAARHPGADHWASDRAQQLEVIIHDLRGGLHEGLATRDVLDAMAKGAES